jgi:hypothetical protein
LSASLEIGIFVSHIIWLARTRSIRKQAAADGKTFDEIAAEHAERGVAFKFAERRTKKARKDPSDQQSTGCVLVDEILPKNEKDETSSPTMEKV